MSPPFDLMEGRREEGETLFPIQMLSSKLEAFSRNPVRRQYYADPDPDLESDFETKEHGSLDQQAQVQVHGLPTRLGTPPSRMTLCLTAPSAITENRMTTDSATATASFARMETLDPGLKARIQDTLRKVLSRLLNRHRKGKDKEEGIVRKVATEALLPEKARVRTAAVMTSSPPMALPGQGQGQGHSHPVPLRRKPTVFLNISQAHGRANRGHRGRLQPVGLEEELRQEEEEKHYGG